MNPSPTPERLATLLPDEPKWIDLKGLLLSGRCDVWAESDPERGFAARSWDYPFSGIFGEPGADLILNTVTQGGKAFRAQHDTETWQLLASSESRRAVAAALPDWSSRLVILHRFRGSLDQRADNIGARIEVLPEGHGAVGLTFDHVPAATRDEYTLEWVSHRPMAVAIVDSVPVSFCYAAFTTDTLWDVSIETLRPYRRQGLARTTFLALARYMTDQEGLAPTWGAMEDNPGSLGLAAKLGFVPEAQLDGWSERLGRRL